MIVTHQKRTMEIASMMYGVSLNKDGTTKILCQRLEHPDVPEPEPESGEDERRPAEEPVAELIEVPEGERVG
jgi:hypothetical protein